MSRETVYAFSTEQLVVGTGTSQAIGVTTYGGQNAIQFKILSGGTLWVGGEAGLSAAVGGSCYLVTSGEVLSANMSGRFYLYASGATTTVCIIRGRTSGYEVS